MGDVHIWILCFSCFCTACALKPTLVTSDSTVNSLELDLFAGCKNIYVTLTPFSLAERNQQGSLIGALVLEVCGDRVGNPVLQMCFMDEPYASSSRWQAFRRSRIFVEFGSFTRNLLLCFILHVSAIAYIYCIHLMLIQMYLVILWTSKQCWNKDV